MTVYTLLSLIPPSCMVAPKRDLGNIHFSTSAFTFTTTYMAFIPASKVMNIDNYDNIRERTSSSNKASSKSTLIFSNTSS